MNTRPRSRPSFALPAALLLLSTALTAAPPDSPAPAPLPPELPWSGKSLELVAADDDPWITPCEKSGFASTPSYDETVDWLERLVEAAPELRGVPIGRSHEGRTIWMVVASAEGASSAEDLRRNGRPTVLAQCGIHSGEIDGKDAGMMLLRDMTVGRSGRHRLRGLLDNANLLFVPILNADGHERTSPFGRINQRGPDRMGWRTNGRNLNLNRDWTKLDTPGVRAIVTVLDEWQPDLFLDIHVTDGIDYQYDITFGYMGAHGYSPGISAWLDSAYRPGVSAALSAMGHVPGPLIFAKNGRDTRAGLYAWTGSPRYSDTYGALRHTPTLLVENHSLKPHRQRVLGTYVLLESTLRVAAEGREALRAAIASDRARRPRELVLRWQPTAGPPKTVKFLGVASETERSEVSGDNVVRWLGTPTTERLEVHRNVTPGLAVSRPKAYWVPASWPHVIERIRHHGIRIETVEQPKTVDVQIYRLVDPELGLRPFEGRVQVTTGTKTETRREVYAPGSIRVPTDQPLGDLAIALLEPRSPDSFFAWGFFLEVLQRTEYVEGYVMEPLAKRMLADDADLRAEFEKKLAENAAFRKDPRARLEWFYRRTPYHDERYLLYPVGRETGS